MLLQHGGEARLVKCYGARHAALRRSGVTSHACLPRPHNPVYVSVTLPLRGYPPTPRPRPPGREMLASYHWALITVSMESAIRSRLCGGAQHCKGT